MPGRVGDREVNISDAFEGIGACSRGLITAPLCGELLAAWLNDEPLPVPASVAEACHPNRFALRTLIRGKAPAR